MSTKIRLLLFVFIALGSACAPIYQVDSEGDQEDFDLTDGKCQTSFNTCTMRAAIQQANAKPGTGIPFGGINAVIEFEGVDTIAPATQLPNLSRGGLKIRGYGAVTLDGGQPTACSGGMVGLRIKGSTYNTIQGLTLVNFQYALEIDGTNMAASSNIIGANPGNSTDPAFMRNVIGANCVGIYIHGQDAAENIVAGNYIGTNADGSTANPNVTGVNLSAGAHDNLIGSTTGGIIPLIDPVDQVAFWKLDEVGGNRADSVGTNTLVDNQAALSAPGKIVIAADFEADSNQFLEISDNPVLSTGDIDFTFSAWVMFESKTGDGIIISKQDGSANREYRLYYRSADDRFVFRIFNNSGTSIGEAIADQIGSPSVGSWYFITAWHSAANDQVGILVNAGAANTFATTGVIADKTASFRLGAQNSSEVNFWDGLIDEVGFWKRVLTPQEIEALYNNGDGLAHGQAGYQVSNVISANSSAGISIGESSDNLIAGNYIGTTLTGNSPLGNDYGIYLASGANANIIGIDGDQGAPNVISANGYGIQVDGNANDNMIAGNLIGTNNTGTTALGNEEGIHLAGFTNLVGTDADGANDLAEANVISANTNNGIRISSSFNTVAGNLIGTDLTGLLPLGNGDSGIELSLGANDNVIGTNGDGIGDAAERNVISANASSGIEINGQGTDTNIVAGNYVGTNIEGTGSLGNKLDGILISAEAQGNLIGTNADGLSDSLEANVISANLGSGVFVIHSSSNLISGNFIGTDKTGSLPLPNLHDGVHINGSNVASTQNNWIGGTNQSANVIAFNMQAGIEIYGFSVFPGNSQILSNSIFSNGELSLDLVSPDSFSGDVNPNDSGDGDNGPNSLLNFPILDAAVSANNSTAVTGQIVDGLPNTTFLIQFFYNAECDPSGYGEGENFLGQTNKTTNASGDVAFTVNFPTGITPGSFITSTATFSDETSEFSACEQVVTQLNQEIEQTPDLVSIVPTRNLNCRNYCTSQSEIADTLLEGVEYFPVGWDPITGYLAFMGPSFGELCFAPPLAEGTQLMAINVGGQAASTDFLTADLIELISCPLFPTATPTIDLDEGDATEPSLPQCSDRIDNDGDGLIDLSDRECRDPNDDDEANP